ncbi:MAG TPA: DinB family protein [Chloroflexia bacterium]|nr:DinB family protein [Chloroflexia bacterium]
METSWNSALWRQFSAAITMLENAILACPSPLWTGKLWPEPVDQGFPPEFSRFWYIAYHAIFWCDLYLSGLPEEEFNPPAPFIWTELDPAVSPERPYSKEELHAYLVATRRKCQETLLGLTDERAGQSVEYPWTAGKDVSFLELQLYSLRHVQEHAAQLNLFLGQNEVPAVPNWIGRAKDESSGQ